MNSEETKEKDMFAQQDASEENVTAQYVNANIAQKFNETEPVKPSNAVTGIVGALVGSLLGVVVWIAIYHAGYIASIAGIAIIFCTLKGYEILGHSLHLLQKNINRQNKLFIFYNYTQGKQTHKYIVIHMCLFSLWVVTLLSSRSVRNINHPLCGCAVNVIQKNHLSIYNEVVQAEIINERKGDFNGK